MLLKVREKTGNLLSEGGGGGHAIKVCRICSKFNELALK